MMVLGAERRVPPVVAYPRLQQGSWNIWAREDLPIERGLRAPTHASKVRILSILSGSRRRLLLFFLFSLLPARLFLFLLRLLRNLAGTFECGGFAWPWNGDLLSARVDDGAPDALTVLPRQAHAMKLNYRITRRVKAQWDGMNRRLTR